MKRLQVPTAATPGPGPADVDGTDDHEDPWGSAPEEFIKDGASIMGRVDSKSKPTESSDVDNRSPQSLVKIHLVKKDALGTLAFTLIELQCRHTSGVIGN